MELSGRRIVVTGATRGIGQALTEQLVVAGAEVLAVARDSAALENLVQDLGDGVVPLSCDLAVAIARTDLIGQLLHKHLPLDGLINNAGTQTETDFLKDPQDWLAQTLAQEVAVNLEAPLHLAIALMPHLAQRPEAFVMNVGSALALSPKQAAPIYCATKAGLRNFSKGLRYQAGKSKVQIIDVVMALVETEMTQGRGRGKISADRAAAELLTGITRGDTEIWVGKTQFLRVIDRIAPALTARILR